MFRSSRDVGSLPTPTVQKLVWDGAETDVLYGCDICSDGGWTSETEVEIHKTKIHYKKAFINSLRKRDDYCLICIKKCPDKESVVRHIKSEHLLSTETCIRVEREIYICDKCAAIFFSKDNLIIHLRYAHLDMKNMERIKCLICHKNILIHNIPAHFYKHNIQSVSTCRICLIKCHNTKILKEHISKTHPHYLKCDMCYYETSRVDSFHNHILLRHKSKASIKVGNSISDDTKLNDDKIIMTVDTDPNKDSKMHNGLNEKNLMIGNVKKHNSVKENENDTLTELDTLTIIEISDKDPVTHDEIKNEELNNRMIKNLMTDDDDDSSDEVVSTISKRSKQKLKGIKKKLKSESTIDNLIKDFTMRDSYLTINVPVVKNLVKDNTAVSDNDIGLIILEDLMTDETVKDESVHEQELTMDAISDSNLMTVIEVSNNEGTNLTGDVNRKSTNQNQIDLTTKEAVSDNNLMTVIEICDDFTTDNIFGLTDSVKNKKDSIQNDVSISETSITADTSSTDNRNIYNDLMSNDATGSNVVGNMHFTENVKTIIHSISENVTYRRRKSDKSLVSPYVTGSFRRFFIPESPAYVRLQRIAGIRGIRLSNDVHICVLCREVCVGLEEMRSHINEHTVKIEKKNNYVCSCGELFTNKVLLKHHAFKNKHNIN